MAAFGPCLCLVHMSEADYGGNIQATTGAPPLGSAIVHGNRGDGTTAAMNKSAEEATVVRERKSQISCAP